MNDWEFELIDNLTPNTKKRKKEGRFDIKEIVPAEVIIQDKLEVNIDRTAAFAWILVAIAFCSYFIWLKYFSGAKGDVSFIAHVFIFSGFLIFLYSAIRAYMLSFKKPLLLINAEGITFKKVTYYWEDIEDIKLYRFKGNTGFNENLEIYLKWGSMRSIDLGSGLLNGEVRVVVAYILFYRPCVQS